jgi:enoyl-CoA hydratase/carnithine racemase
MSAGAFVAHTPFEHILFETRGPVARITLNEPKRLNAIDHGPGSMEEEIVAALALADGDDAIRCTIVTGAGRAFSAGGDMGLGPIETAYDHLAFLEGTNRANERIRTSLKPTIGAINGMCLGAALIFALHLDLLIAARSARLGLIETRFGAVGVELLPFFVGLQWAKFLAISGEVITADKAKEIGLVLEVFPDEQLQPKVEDLARRIAAMPRHGVLLNRRLLVGAATMMGWSAQKELAVALNTVTNAMSEHATAADGRNLQRVLRDEGWQAFKEARDAAFAEPWLEPEAS